MELIDNLNKNQKIAATSTNKRVQIIAGAGTGKTHTLIARIAYMVSCGVDPKNILLITFTNKAADEMKERADIETEGRCKNVTAKTYHAFCADMIREYGEYYDDQYKDVQILSDTDADEFANLAHQRYDDMLKPLKRKVPKNKRLGVRDVLNMLSMSINTEKDFEDIAKEKGYNEDGINYAKAVAEVYILEKRKHKKLDFDDLLTEFLRILNTNSVFRENLKKRYRYILVDEHQDSNNIQDKIISLLTGPNTFLTVVGDEFQSIYAFRGANVENFMKFKDNYLSDNNEEPLLIPLEENYRSTKEILDFGNSVTRNANFGAPKNLTSDKTGIKPSLIRVQDAYESSEKAFSLIKNYAVNSPIEEIAVLARNAREMAFLESILKKEGIAYEMRGGLKFFEHACVLDILAFQRLCVNNLDELQWFRILRQLKDVGYKRAQEIIDGVGKKDFLINTRFAEKKNPTSISIHEQLETLHQIFESLKQESDLLKQLDIIIEYITDIYNKQIEIQKKEGRADQLECYQNKLASLQIDEEIFRSLLKKYKDKPLQKWIDDIALNPTAKEDINENMLVLSTIHSAKGLEWNHVILINASEGGKSGGLPSAQTLNQKDTNKLKKELDEERRVFYVAVTRPRFTLDLIVPNRNMIGDPTTISRFIEESYNLVNETY